MKVRIKNSVLQHMLKDVNQVKGSREDTLPVLGFVMLKADKTGLSLSRTNLEITVQRKELEGVTIESEGECLAPASVFEGAVGNMGEFVEILFRPEVSKKVLLSDENVNYELFSLPIADFPKPIGIDKPTAEISLNGSLFLNKFRDVWIACSEDDSRKTLQGVNAEITKDSINVAATDGKRLCAHAEGIDVPKNPVSIIMPKKNGLEETAKILYSCEPEDVSFKTDGSLVCISFPGCELSFKLIGGTYPGWRGIIPDEYGYEVSFESSELLASLKAVSVIDPQYVTLSIVENSIAVVGENAVNGHCDGVIPCISENKKPIKVQFSVDFILSYMRKVPNGNVTMKISKDGRGPIQFDYEGLLYWIMPMRDKEPEEGAEAETEEK